MEISMEYYRPDGTYMWDTWCVQAKDIAHLYHLQILTQDSKRPKADADFLGHAVSKDLIHWKECNYSLGPNVDGTDDDMQPWTGCTVYHDNKFYMFYTMRSKKNSAAMQKIGLAISDDGYNFKRYENNPVIVPDNQWYVNTNDYFGCVDCRDLVVVKYKDYWLGYYAARVHGYSPIETAAVACVKSYDLIHWEHMPPVFVPRKYNCIEVPDVFHLNGRWYLTLLAGHGYGSRGVYTDKNCIAGSIYAVSDSPYGPFKELDTNVYIGGGPSCGSSCRTLMFNGKRYLMFTQVATLSQPYLVDTDKRGYLILRYPSDLTPKKSDSLDFPKPRLLCAHGAWNAYTGEWFNRGNVYSGKSRLGWQAVHIFDGSKHMEIEADITIKSGTAAGITIRVDKTNGAAGSDYSAILDTNDKRVAFVDLATFYNWNARELNVIPNKTYHMHLTKDKDRINVFVDDELYIQASIAFDPNGNFGIGAVVDRGEAEIKFTRIWRDNNEVL